MKDLVIMIGTLEEFVLKFMSDVLSLFTVDAVPNGYLYAVYCEWMKKNNIAEKVGVLGRNIFLEEIKKNIRFFPEWHIPAEQFRVCKYLDKQEETLRLFGLEEWMQDPHSTDPDIKYRLKWGRPCMNGILLTKYKDRPLGRPRKK